MTFWIIQSLNGFSLGMLLFLLTAGLSVIFGLMRIINLTHGSFYLLGAYIGLTMVQRTHNFVLAIVVSAVILAAVGGLILRLFLHRFLKDELAQVLLTFGFLFVFSDIALWIWGGTPQAMPTPAFFNRSLELGAIAFPIYRFFIIAVGLATALLLWLILERTKLGAIIRAGVDDEEMAQGAGQNMPFVFMVVFAMGALLAGVGGVIGGPLIGAYPGADFEVLLLAFVVVIVGGLGSLRGAFFGSLVVGLIDTFGKSLFPEFALFTVFVPMAIILAVRPKGLFGRG